MAQLHVLAFSQINTTKVTGSLFCSARTQLDWQLSHQVCQQL